MLELRAITKSYILDKNCDLPVLKGIDLVLDNQEFVSILGPSGCGKTTLLNILGGLDRYTSGDIIVDGVSTKDFSDKDWDNYRNRRIGIVFQNYNLIPHLTVLSNVELAMTLSGVTNKYRKKKAIEALKSVGLGEVINKHPNQLSGGQMQRVAIARAIVNNPGIILADEPTGALDSKTSLQIMDILRELSKTRLVIMVTHNEEIATSYSTRILRMLDGVIIADEKIPQKGNIEVKKIDKDSTIDSAAPDLTLIDNSFSSQLQEELSRSKGQKKKKEKTAMSFGTALNISSHNLLTKKGRTTLTSIAGSFGIIGIALILAMSNGFKHYVRRMETETLSQFPISVEKYGLPSGSSASKPTIDQPAYPDSDEIIIEKPTQNILHVNTISNEYIEHLNNMDPAYVNSIQYNYSVQMNAVTLDSSGNPINLNTAPNSLVSSLMSSSYWSELPGSEEFIRSQYDIIGEYPRSENELLISVDKYNRVSYNTMAALGFDTNFSATESSKTISFEELLDKTYKVFSNDDIYEEATGTTESGYFLKEDASPGRIAQLLSILSERYSSGENIDQLLADKDFIELTSQFKTTPETKTLKYYNKKSGDKLLDIFKDSAKGEEVKIVGILRPKATTSVDLLGYGVYYTSGLVQQTLKTNANTALATELKNHCLASLNGGTLNIKYFSAIGSNSATDLSGYMAERLAAATDKDITSITIFPKGFAEKTEVLKYLDKFNSDHLNNKVVYTDLAAVLTDSVGTMIDIISIVLICFAAISLVVSSVMIGIITYVSVIERTKEIGILRSIGARKKDVSRLFQAETVIVGLISGLFGVIVTYILSLPINLILNNVFPDVQIGNIANLDPFAALALILISVVLTFIAGFIPARMASKKDPVVCLRTE